MSTFVSLENLQRLCTGVSEAVNTKFDTLNTQVNGLYFAQDDDGNWGYKTSESGDVTPFKLSTGTATAAEVLSGYTFSNSVSQNVSGTMTNQGNVTKTLAAGGSYTIPEGYHGGGGTVTANSLASQTNATATAARILNGYTAYVNGSKVTGNMTNRGNVSSTIAAGASYTIPAGYHGGGGKITASNLSSQTSGNATAARILNGYTAWVNGSEITGNMTNRGNVTTTLNCGSSYTIPAGYHGGGGTVTANSLSSQTVGNITAARVLNGYVGWANGTKYTGSMNNWGSNTVNMSSNTATLSAGYYSSISINAASRYTAGYNARSITTTTIGTFNSSANLNAGATSTNIANYATFNVANSISSYANLSASNLYVANVVIGLYHEQGSSSGASGMYNTSRTISISYNASNGIANVSGLKTSSLTQDTVYTSIAFVKSFKLCAKYLA